VNAQGGLLGRRVELIDYDVSIDSKKAQSTVRRFIDRTALLARTFWILPVLPRTVGPCRWPR
jgi:ABC-type branched-subunit amino acid transport system substrate-binding protein